ncbi:Peroxin-3-domain-containing protein [Amanita rubescens]|nr:Peroxin-3-domain-containing protein [Amanita rubescens]
MLQSMRTYIYERRKGLAKTAAFVGGVYLVQRYVTDRLEELKVKLDQEKLAREALKRRFQTAQEDVSYTVLALLPTLAEQIMEGMDVESLTQELQARSKARTTAGLQQTIRQQHEANPDEGHSHSKPNAATQHERDGTQRSLGSSMVHVDLEVRSEAGSTASTSFVDASSRDGESSGINSWMEASTSGRSPRPLSGDSSSYHIPNEHQLSDSVLTEGSVGNESRLSDSVASMSAASDSAPSRTKVELWNEVKMLTFTRTLTTLYSITLLCLLTTIQLTVLARSKYVNSVLDVEREERLQEQLESELSLPNLLLSHSTKMVQDLLSVDLSMLEDEAEEGELEGDMITEEVERKFLTLSWWILHVGWKDVGERVRRGVEEVFEGVSLKTKLAAIDLHRLIRDVRRRVEHEVTFEGHGRRINFLSTLLPPTPEMIQHVLTQGGFLSESSPDPSTSRDDQSSQTHDTTTQSFSELSHDFDASPATGLSGMFNNSRNPHNVAPIFSHNPLVNPTGAHNHVHHRNGIDQDADACIDCASVSHLPPHPETHPHPMLKHVQDPPFVSLVEETRAVITSPDFEYVLEACLDSATSVLFEGLEKSVFVASEDAPGEEVRIRLAGLLPGLAKWSRLALRGLPNELVDSLLVLREVPCLSAIVFSKFEEKVKVL